MNTRSHTHEIDLTASPERVFAILHTPSAIRGWWGASRCIVHPIEGGTWAAAWGDEDDPDYLTIARIAVFAPPRSMVLDHYRYRARTGPMPFDAEFRTEFTVTPAGRGCVLRVEQTGFPIGPEADEFYAGCKKGWRDTFESIRRFLGEAEHSATIGA